MMRTAIIAAALVVTTSLAPSAATAAPTPDGGPIIGGTTVTLELPDAEISFAKVDGGGRSAVALGTDGRVYSWGDGSFGVLGNGSSASLLSAGEVTLPPGERFIDVSVSGFSAIALSSTGAAYAWGDNSSGQLGNGTTAASLLPVPVSMPSDVGFVDVEMTSFAAYGLTGDGRIFAWGSGFGGLLGNGDTADSPVPVQVDSPAPGVEFARLAMTTGAFPAAIGTDGAVYGWGANWSGVVGDGTTDDRWVPTRSATPAGVAFTEIATSEEGSHAVALTSQGEVYTWGLNFWGQLGDGTTAGSAVPQPVALPEGVRATKVLTTYRGSMFLGSDGFIYAWGGNYRGQLGLGDTSEPAVPTRAQTPPGVTFTDIASGSAFAFGRGSDGSWYAWGDNEAGQLGVGSTSTNELQPVRVVTPEAQPVVLTGVTFGGASADPSTFVEVSPGVWEVLTPMHVAGPVDVVVEWTLGGVPQTPLLYTDGFAYREAPALAPIAPVTIACGSSATLATRLLSGYPAPSIQWEVSTDDGATWQPVGSDAGLDPDDITLEVVGAEADRWRLYRLTATNSEGAASVEVDVELEECGPAGGGTDEGGTGFEEIPGAGEPSSAQGELAVTGGESGTLPVIAALLLAAGLLAFGVARRRRTAMTGPRLHALEEE